MKKKKATFSPEEVERFARNQQRLAERIAYHEAKLAEEKAARGG
jgi:hypothetical protein